MNASDAHKAHRILSRLFEGRAVPNEEREFLRNALPELPKQKTLEEICEDVALSLNKTNGDQWGDEAVYLESWLKELHAQLEGIKDAPADTPAHPEFLETEADYQNTPVGTVAIHEDGYPWTRIFGSWVAYSCNEYSPYEMAALRGKARVLRWGNK